MITSRLEAFSDGVLAIILTIMVLELKAPHGATMASLRPLLPIFLSYVLSFVYVGIYWNNHHHMLHAAERVTGRTLWANLHLLFWLSLIPFVTAWMGENHFASAPVAIYGVVLFMAAVSYWLLVLTLMATHSPNSTFVRVMSHDTKGKVSLVLYGISIPAAFWHQWISGALYVATALMWLLPDERIERELIRDLEPESQPAAQRYNV